MVYRCSNILSYSFFFYNIYNEQISLFIDKSSFQMKQTIKTWLPFEWTDQNYQMDG